MAFNQRQLLRDDFGRLVLRFMRTTGKYRPAGWRIERRYIASLRHNVPQMRKIIAKKKECDIMEIVPCVGPCKSSVFTYQGINL